MTNGKKRGVHITDDRTINIIVYESVAPWPMDPDQ